MKEEEDGRWAAILRTLLELPIHATSKVKEDTHGYNYHRIHNKHKVCSYEEPYSA